MTAITQRNTLRDRWCSAFPAVGIGRAGTALAAIVLCSPLATVSASEVSEQKLERRLQQQEATVEEMRTQLEALREQREADAERSKPEMPGGVRIFGTDTTIKIGGYLKGTLIHDIDARSDDFITFSQIPLDGSPRAEQNDHTRLHARESRFNIATRTPLQNGFTFSTFVEVDFFGGGPAEFASAEQRITNSHSPRLRQAVGRLSWDDNEVLAGQTWTTFMHPAMLTDQIDFSQPPGAHFIRQPMFRYSRDLGQGAGFAVSIENPESELNGDGISGGPPFNPAQENDRIPDLLARYTTSGSWGLGYISGVLREHRADDGVDLDESVIGWGVGVGLRTRGLYDGDVLRVRAGGGEGIGRYIKELAGQGATLNVAKGDLEAIPGWGGSIGYTRQWSPEWRSNLIAGYTEVDNEDITSVQQTNKQIYSGHINLFYSPLPSVDLGVEFVHGNREVESGDDGTVNRLLLGGRFNF